MAETYDWDKHWERVSNAYIAEFGIPWLNIPPPKKDELPDPAVDISGDSEAGVTHG